MFRNSRQNDDDDDDDDSVVELDVEPDFGFEAVEAVDLSIINKSKKYNECGYVMYLV